MRVYLFAFGKLRTPGLREAAEYYQKLIRPWVHLEVVELKPIPVPDKSAATRLKIQAKESEILLEKIESQLSSASSRVGIYLLDETGKAHSTEQWAKQAREWEDHGPAEAALCIGSSLGFSPELRKKARGVFSLGPQTLPHELARVVLLEQLYRAWSVIRGHPYHNAD